MNWWSSSRFSAPNNPEGESDLKRRNAKYMRLVQRKIKIHRMEKFMYGKRLKEYVYLIGSVINNKMRRML